MPGRLDESHATNYPKDVPVSLGMKLEEVQKILADYGIPASLNADGSQLYYYDQYGFKHFYYFDKGKCYKMGADSCWLTEEGAEACFTFYKYNTCYNGTNVDSQDHFTFGGNSSYDDFAHFINGSGHDVKLYRYKTQDGFNTQYTEALCD